jgi:chaperonin GroEL
MREFTKSKTASKIMTTDAKKLKKIVLETIDEASKAVGSTLGPNGKVVLIERQENLDPFTTKDGITVFNSMAYNDSTKQAVLEAARSSSSKTNVEAGDGTTTATILAASLIRLGFEYLEKNPSLSVQQVMRELEHTYRDLIEPFIKNNSIKITNDNDQDLIRKVALIATNNDEEMSDAVVEGFNLVGHNGQITIAEEGGGTASGFGVEKIEGFPIARGFEDSCGRFLEEFINDKSNYRTVLDKPKFILYNGKINEPSVLFPILQKVAEATGLQDGRELSEASFSPNIVIVAHHFSETVTAWFAQNFKNSGTLNLIPLKTPNSYQANGPYHFLLDLAAYTGASVFDSLTRPLATGEISDLGTANIQHFEFYRYKSILIGEPDEVLVIQRVEELEQQIKHAESSMDRELTTERMALLTGGIARIKVYGSSDSELKEKKHRVEDAVMAIKGALREGVLPGCAKTLLTLAYMIAHSDRSEAVKQIMGKALVAPFHRIFSNGGYNAEHIKEIYEQVMDLQKPFFYTYDALNHKHGDGLDMGIVDSASAVLMSLKNSLGVAKMLMGLSGIIVFQRDHEKDRSEGENFHEENRAMEEAIAESNRQQWEPPY